MEFEGTSGSYRNLRENFGKVERASEKIGGTLGNFGEIGENSRDGGTLRNFEKLGEQRKTSA